MQLLLSWCIREAKNDAADAAKKRTFAAKENLLRSYMNNFIVTVDSIESH